MIERQLKQIRCTTLRYMQQKPKVQMAVDATSEDTSAADSEDSIEQTAQYMYIEHMQLQNKKIKQMKMAEELAQIRDDEELETMRLERLRERAEREKNRAKTEE